MSVDASINLRIAQTLSGEVVPPTKILEILLANGWRLQRDGGVFYLENDDSDWALEPMSTESLMKILTKKEINDERIGVTITWQDTYIGGEILFWGKDESLKKGIYPPICFSLTSDRKLSSKYEHLKMTDVNWYLERLLPIFNQGDYFVEYFTYEEHK